MSVAESPSSGIGGGGGGGGLRANFYTMHTECNAYSPTYMNVVGLSDRITHKAMYMNMKMKMHFHSTSNFRY